VLRGGLEPRWTRRRPWPSRGGLIRLPNVRRCISRRDVLLRLSPETRPFPSSWLRYGPGKSLSSMIREIEHFAVFNDFRALHGVGFRGRRRRLMTGPALDKRVPPTETCHKLCFSEHVCLASPKCRHRATRVQETPVGSRRPSSRVLCSSEVFDRPSGALGFRSAEDHRYASWVCPRTIGASRPLKKSLAIGIVL
jgi:hypothetical protein